MLPDASVTYVPDCSLLHSTSAENEMTDMHSARGMAQAGMLLIVLALLTGLAVPVFHNPRMAIATHMTGIMGGLVIVAVGSMWSQLALSTGQARLTKVLVLAGFYSNWAISSLAAAWGTNRNTPVAGAGFGAAPWQESLVAGLQVAMSPALLVALGLIVFGLRRSATD